MSNVSELSPSAAIEITGEIKPEYEQVLTPDALAFVADLHREFEAERQRVYWVLRAERQARFDCRRVARLFAGDPGGPGW